MLSLWDNIKVLPPASRRQAAVHRTAAIDLSSHSLLKKKQDRFPLETVLFYGAGDEARTRYLHLGKVALYRMSYTRNGHDVL